MRRGIAAGLMFALAVLLTQSGAYAQESIVDPENPLASPADGGETDDGGELIFDPENPVTSEGASGEDESSEPTPRRVIFSGFYLGQIYIDAVMNEGDEDVYLVLNRLDMRIRLNISESWRVVLEGRLEVRVWGGDDPHPVEDPLLDNNESVQGTAEPLLRDAYLTGHFGNFFLTLGNQTIVWGAGTIVNPAGVINPLDRRGGTADWPEDRRIPVIAADLTAVIDKLSLSAVLVPFFVPARLDLLGTDWALLPPIIGQSYDLTQLFRLLPGVDETFLARIQEELLVTEFPTAAPQNVSAGARVKSRYGGVDIGLGYFYGWDRLPFVEITGNLADVLVDLLAGERATLPIDSRYLRLHTLELDLVTFLGPVALRLESVFKPERTAYLDIPGGGFEARQFPMLTNVLALSYTPNESFWIQLEGVYAHTFDVPEGQRLLISEPNDWVVVLGTVLRLDAFSSLAGTAVGSLGFSFLGRYSISNRDYVLSLAAFWTLQDRITFSAGGLVYGGPPEDEKLTLGGIYADNDQIYLSIAVDF